MVRFACMSMVCLLLGAASHATAQIQSPDVPPHLKYLSPRCAGLNDALRTARSRGLAWDTVSGMQKEYSLACADNERDAYSKVSQERGDEARKRHADMLAERQTRERASLHDQQCQESKRILATKKARTDLTDGEKADLQRFETNYRARCG